MSITLLTAEGPRLEAILDATYAIWGEGLSRHAYGQWNRGQMATAWGRGHLRRVALVDRARGDRLLASAKRYDFDGILAGQPVSMLGIGAVFTPEDQRGRGHAQALVEALIADAATRGCACALLFSEIGTAYYARLGFQTIARSMLTLDVTRKEGAPATFIRAGEPEDFPALAEISVQYSRDAGFALRRTPDLIEFGVVRRRLLAGLGPSGVRAVEFFVAEEGHRPAAYVLLTRGPAGLVLEDCGDRDPSGARIGAILQVLMARTPAERPEPIRAWLPPSLRPPQIRVVTEGPAPEPLMIRPIGGVASSDREVSPVVYWPVDVF